MTLQLNRDVTLGRCYLVRGLTTVLTLRGSSAWTEAPVLEFAGAAPITGDIQGDVAVWTVGAGTTATVLGSGDRAAFNGANATDQRNSWAAFEVKNVAGSFDASVMYQNPTGSSSGDTQSYSFTTTAPGFAVFAGYINGNHSVTTPSVAAPAALIYPGLSAYSFFGYTPTVQGLNQVTGLVYRAGREDRHVVVAYR